MSNCSNTPGVSCPMITSSGAGSPGQQAAAAANAAASRQAAANKLAGGKRKGKGKRYRGGAITLAPLSVPYKETGGTSISALNANVAIAGSQAAANGQYDNAAKNNYAATKGGKRSRQNKRTSRTKRNYRKSMKRRTYRRK